MTNAEWFQLYLPYLISMLFITVIGVKYQR